MNIYSTFPLNFQLLINAISKALLAIYTRL